MVRDPHRLAGSAQARAPPASKTQVFEQGASSNDAIVGFLPEVFTTPIAPQKAEKKKVYPDFQTLREESTKLQLRLTLEFQAPSGQMIQVMGRTFQETQSDSQNLLKHARLAQACTRDTSSCGHLTQVQLGLVLLVHFFSGNRVAITLRSPIRAEWGDSLVSPKWNRPA